MNHLNGLGLENFRVFKTKTWFDFAPITILTGTNSSGKSSLINAIEVLTSEPEEKIKDDFFESILYKDVPALKHFHFSKYQLYSRKLSKRLGDFATFQSNKNSDVTIYYRTAFNFNDQVIELALTYHTTDTLIKVGQLKRIAISAPEVGQEIISIDAESGFTRLAVNYEYFFQQLSSSLAQKKYKGFMWADTEELESIFKDGIKYYEGNGESLYNYGFKPKQYLDEGDDIVTEGNQGEFEEQAQAFEELYRDDINNFKSIEFFFAAYEKKFLENYTIYLKSDVLKNSSLLHIIQIISNPIGKYQKNRNVEFSKTQNPIELFIHLEYSKAEIEKDLSKFPYWFFNSFVGENVANVLREVDSYTGVFLKPNRAEIQRIYNDSEGFENLQSLSNQIYRLQTLKQNFHRISRGIDAIGFINFSLKLLEIGDEILFKRNPDSSSTLVYIKNNQQETLLGDVGYGVSQILSFVFEIALKIAAIEFMDHTPSDFTDTISDFNFEDIYSQDLIIVEEPESNLHPANQSRLADIIVKATKTFGIQFIIETHSEYLIRRLQVLTADQSSALKPEDTQLYYFYHPNHVPEGEKQAYPINIQMDGSLTKNFGRGFFDEASNLNIALYQFTLANKN